MLITIPFTSIKGLPVYTPGDIISFENDGLPFVAGQSVISELLSVYMGVCNDVVFTDDYDQTQQELHDRIVIYDFICDDTVELGCQVQYQALLPSVEVCATHIQTIVEAAQAWNITHDITAMCSPLEVSRYLVSDNAVDESLAPIVNPPMHHVIRIQWAYHLVETPIAD